MKRIFKQSTLCVLLVISLILSGCTFNLDFFDTETNTNDQVGTTNPVENSVIGVIKDQEGNSKEIKKVECFAREVADYSQNFTSFMDETYYYYVFRIGRIYNVALEAGARDYYHGFEEKELQFSVSNVNSSSVEKASSEVVSKSNTSNYSVSESFKYSRASSSSFGAEIYNTSLGLNRSQSFELGLEATQAWGFSQTETVSNSYKSCVDTANTESKILTLKFNSNYPSGYYNYVLIGDLDIYKLVLVNKHTKEFELYDFSSIVGSNRQLIYLGEDPEYRNEPTSPLNFELKEVETYLSTIPSTNISDYSKNRVIEVPVSRQNSDDGAKYDTSKQEHDEAWKKAHDHFEIGKVLLYGCKNIGNAYTISNSEMFGIQFRLDVNPNDLPRNSSNNKMLITDDDCNQVVHTNINSTIGQGAYWVRITYTDGTQQKQYFDTNIFSNSPKGSYIQILSLDNLSGDINSISKIELTIVYEVRVDTGWVFTYQHTNWRCDYVFNFNN